MRIINQKRIIQAMIIFLIIISGLGIRLFYIMICCHEDFLTAETNQSSVQIIGTQKRGAILDRNMKALTGSTYNYLFFIKKTKENSQSSALFRQMGGRQIAKKTGAYSVYCMSTFDRERAEILKDKFKVLVYRDTARYEKKQPACHLIGYINEAENRGVSGLELMYDTVLDKSDTKTFLTADAAGTVLPGIGPRNQINSKNQVSLQGGIVTSIDRNLQIFCEELFEKKNFTGACIVSEAKTAQILAWVSAPTFDPMNVEDYLNQNSDCLVNKVVQGTYAPGSVFKPVIAAAALENAGSDENLEETLFDCSSRAAAGGILINCRTAPQGGHGLINLVDAMTYSCNCFFVKLGLQTGYENIRDMATKMGYGQTLTKGYPEELTGNLPVARDISQGDTGNISIGQGSLTVTPLQVHTMMSVIANKGIRKAPVIVLTQNKDQQDEAVRVISENTAAAVEKSLRKVMTDGTGRGNKLQVPVYGKTGTAETGNSGTGENNCWFSGYCDIGRKRYVVTVLVENGNTGSSEALPVFSEIVNYLTDRF